MTTAQGHSANQSTYTAGSRLHSVKELKDYIVAANKFRYISLFHLAQQEFVFKNSVLRKLLVRSEETVNLIVKYNSSDYKLSLLPRGVSEFLTNQNIRIVVQEESSSLQIGPLLFLISSKPNVEGVELTDQDGRLCLDVKCSSDINREGYGWNNGKTIVDLSKVKRFDSAFPVLHPKTFDVSDIQNFGELVEILYGARRFTYITVLKELPKKNIAWMNTQYRGFIVNERPVTSEATTILTLLNDAELQGVQGNNECSIHLNREKFRWYGSKLYTPELYQPFHHVPYSLILIGDAMILLHEHMLIELDVRIENKQPVLEFKYCDDGFYIRVSNKDITISISDTFLDSL